MKKSVTWCPITATGRTISSLWIFLLGFSRKAPTHAMPHLWKQTGFLFLSLWSVTFSVWTTEFTVASGWVYLQTHCYSASRSSWSTAQGGLQQQEGREARGEEKEKKDNKTNKQTKVTQLDFRDEGDAVTCLLLFIRIMILPKFFSDWGFHCARQGTKNDSCPRRTAILNLRQESSRGSRQAEECDETVSISSITRGLSKPPAVTTAMHLVYCHYRCN